MPTQLAVFLVLTATFILTLLVRGSASWPFSTLIFLFLLAVEASALFTSYLIGYVPSAAPSMAGGIGYVVGLVITAVCGLVSVALALLLSRHLDLRWPWYVLLLALGLVVALPVFRAIPGWVRQELDDRRTNHFRSLVTTNATTELKAQLLEDSDRNLGIALDMQELAARTARLDTLVLLLETPAMRRYPDPKKRLSELLFAALRNPNRSVAEYLLDRGASPDFTDYDHRTAPMLVAANLGHLDSMRLLAAHGAKVTVLSENGGNALHWAASGEPSGGPALHALMKWLVEQGVDPDRANSDGFRPLAVAIHAQFLSSTRKQTTEAIEALLAVGADPGLPGSGSPGSSAIELVQALPEDIRSALSRALAAGRPPPAAR
jgi:hypothetical protein